MFEQLLKAILNRIGIPLQEEMDLVSQKADRLLKDIEKLKKEMIKGTEPKTEKSDSAS